MWMQFDPWCAKNIVVQFAAEMARLMAASIEMAHLVVGTLCVCVCTSCTILMCVHSTCLRKLM